MDTLVHKVAVVEDEAQQRVAAAETTSKKKLQALLADEQRVVDDITQGAEERAESIVKEKVRQAKGELNAMHQEEEKSVTVIHAIAETNRARVVERALELFKEEYQS